MSRRQGRLLALFAVLAGVGLAVFFATRALDSQMLFFVDPTMVVQGEYPGDRSFNLGGMVEEGSFRREEGSIKARFVVTDFANRVEVEYAGVLPDLFREGQGIIAEGRLGSGGYFVADRVLAKHDENYMPPNVAESLEKRHAEAQKP